MSWTARNQGFEFGGEFVCTAIPAPGVPLRVTPSRWENPGFRFGDQSVSVNVTLGIPVPSGEFSRYSTSELIKLVQEFASTLTPGELCEIHAIALARFVEAKEPDPSQAGSLSNLVTKVLATQLEARHVESQVTRSTRDEF